MSGQPVPMVRCETVGLEVPASSEIVIEGIARPGRREMEGPFGDHTGYYNDVQSFPVMTVTPMMWRHNPIYHST